MRYFSTRAVDKSQTVSFEEAVLQGLAPDGGLYVPETIPELPLATILSWRDMEYHEIAFQLFRQYVDTSEMADAELLDLLKKSFATFSHPDITPLKKLPGLGPGNLSNLWILELFHGPTFAFKDVALQVLGNLFDFFLQRQRRAAHDHKTQGITIVGATSGDTGGAAIYGLRGKQGIDVFILHPKDRISPVQELQMTTVLDSNIHNVALEGTFDDCQEVVKTLFADSDFKAKYRLGAINSINWARILAQTSYYYYSYFTILKELKVPVDGASSYGVLTNIQYWYAILLLIDQCLFPYCS